MSSSRFAAHFLFLIILPFLSACTSQKGVSSTAFLDISPSAELDVTSIPDAGIPSPQWTATSLAIVSPEELKYTIIHQYPHDAGAFTEGLVFQDSLLYETTGLIGRSSIRKIDLESGRIEKIRHLSDEYFGEGLALVEDKLIWVTWQSNTGFVYDLASFEKITSFTYDHEGWGLAYDGSRLFMSDGTDIIHLLDPENYSETGTISITDSGTPVTEINELEFVEGALYANIWKTNLIARIDPLSGNVTGWLDLSALTDQFEAISRPIDVMNGIAYNKESNSFFVTGKFWPKMFEIQIIPPE